MKNKEQRMAKVLNKFENLFEVYNIPTPHYVEQVALSTKGRNGGAYLATFDENDKYTITLNKLTTQSNETEPIVESITYEKVGYKRVKKLIKAHFNI